MFRDSWSTVIKLQDAPRRSKHFHRARVHCTKFPIAAFQVAGRGRAFDVQSGVGPRDAARHRVLPARVALLVAGRAAGEDEGRREGRRGRGRGLADLPGSKRKTGEAIVCGSVQLTNAFSKTFVQMMRWQVYHTPHHTRSSHYRHIGQSVIVACWRVCELSAGSPISLLPRSPRPAQASSKTPLSHPRRT